MTIECRSDILIIYKTESNDDRIQILKSFKIYLQILRNLKGNRREGNALVVTKYEIKNLLMFPLLR